MPNWRERWSTLRTGDEGERPIQAMADESIKVIATNRKASHDYFLLDRFEAGMALLGTEIKSIRAGGVNLREAYVRVANSEVWLINAHIAPYDPSGAQGSHEPLRTRKLLLHKKEIHKLREALQQKGLTVVPTRLYLSKGRAKLEIALAKGKKQHDKRETIAKRDAEREMRRALRDRG